MIQKIWLAFFVLSGSSPLFAAPGDVSLAKPSVACPQTQLGDEALQSQYDGLWKAYGEKVAAATKAAEDELTRLYESAKSAGNLDLALFWNGMKKSFAETGRLRWEPTIQKKDWKRFGESEFPEGLTAILSKCGSGFDKAKASLEEGYKALEVALTKADRLEQALAMRKEFGALWGAGDTETVTKATAKAEVIDLMKQVKLDEVKGWKRNGGILVSGVLGKEGVSPLSAPIAVHGDFDILAEVSLRNTNPESRTLGMNMGLPGVAGSPRVAALSSNPDRGSCFYVASSVVGEKPPATVLPFAPGFSPNTWQEVLVRVRRHDGGVTVVINGKEVIKAAPFPGSPESRNATLGIDTGLNQMMVRRWELRKFP